MPWGAHDPRDPSVASDTSTRVGEILERAEARAREIREQAERSASEARRTARHEAEGIAKEARRAAATAARARVHRIKQLQASIGDRAESVVEGLEGRELTAARLEELVEALGQAAERVLADVEGAGEAPEPGRHRAPFPSTRPAPLLGEGKPLPRARPSAPATARRREEPAPAARAGEQAPAARRADDVPASWRAGQRPSEPVARPPRITDPLPEGAPMVRKPKRSTPRFSAVMMAIQGSRRDEVADHLAREHGLEDSEQLLDEIFGRADART